MTQGKIQAFHINQIIKKKSIYIPIQSSLNTTEEAGFRRS